MVSLRNNVGPFSSAPVRFFHPPLVQFDLLHRFEFCSSSTLYTHLPIYLSLLYITVQFDLLHRFEFCSSSTLYTPTYLSNIIIHYNGLSSAAVVHYIFLPIYLTLLYITVVLINSAVATSYFI